MTRKELLAAYKKCDVNIMTPTVLAKRVLPSISTVVELSEGTGFHQEPIYGVSVLMFNDQGRRQSSYPDISKMFHSLAEAQEYYDEYPPLE